MIDYDVSDGICVLRLNSPPLNVLTLPLLAEVRQSIKRANANANVKAIVLVGDARRFSAGGDINLFEAVASDADAVELSRVFQGAFGEVEDSAKPVVAALAGPVLGEAIELAAACHIRVCTSATTFAMPEVNLGVNPGAGGTQRLPRLMGLWPALRMMLTAEEIGSQEALELGLVDEICEEDELVTRAVELARAVETPVRTRDRSSKTQDRDDREAQLQKSGKLVAKVRPELIAPRRIVDAVRVGLEESFQAGLVHEQQAFGECVRTKAARNKRYLYFAARQAGKLESLSATEASSVAKASVVGMGTMGTGIAHALILTGIPVAVYDEDGSATERGLDRIKKSLLKRVEGGKLAADRAGEMLRLLSKAGDLPATGDADLIIEAVVEDTAVKQSVLGAIEQACGEQTVIATNTSTISLDRLAEGMRSGERLVGMHFFNPAHRMPLIEIIRREVTPAPILATVMQLAKKMGKTPVLVKNREGFLVNRIFIPCLKEAFYLLEEGVSPAAIDAAMVEFGFPMGPLALTDMAGVDILVFMDAVLSRVFPDHGVLSPIAARLVERGRLGQKSGGGVYDYDRGDYTPQHSAAAQEIIDQARREAGASPRQADAGEIARRLVMRMVAEAFRVMQEGLVQRELDIDAATVLGVAFPDFRGGVLRYAHDSGIDDVISDLHNLASENGERYSPCSLLQGMKGQDRVRRC